MIVQDFPEARFNYRVAGVCLEGGHVLLNRVDHERFWYLPGGRVEILEASPTTLEREMREEVGVDVQVGRLLWVIENFFVFEGRPFHEVGMYFAMALPADSPLLDARRDHVGTEMGHQVITFRWFPLADLGRVHVVPSVLREALLDLPQCARHIVHRDADDIQMGRGAIP
jgi:8-oxo-dGTP pyrophosphatase MutT (NUDIX family)